MYVCMYAYMGVVKVERHQEEGRIDIIGRERRGEYVGEEGQASGVMVNERERVVGKMMNKKKVYYHNRNNS